MSLKSKQVLNIITREIMTLVVIVAAGYFLEMIAVSMLKERLYVYKSFWTNSQFYLIWENSLIENAQIIKILGYPVYLCVRFFFWFTRALAKIGLSETIAHEETKVKEILEDVLKSSRIRRKIDKVDYRAGNNWYIVRFYSPPSCIIPKEYLDNYINGGGQIWKDRIIDCIFESQGDA